MAGKVCAKCGSPNMTSARFCARCGAKLRVEPAPKPVGRQEERPAALLLLGYFLVGLFPGLLRPKVIICSAIVLVLAAAVAGLGLFLIGLGALLTGGWIAACGLILYWSAVAWMLYGEVCLLSEALAEFGPPQWLAMLVSSLVPMAAVYFAIGFAAARAGSALH